MSQPVLYIAVTSHGFGHAVRAASVAELVKKLAPEILLVLVTTAPRWLLESYIQEDFIYRPLAFDVGVIQSDSLSMDKAATLAKMQQIQSRQRSIIAGEVSFIHNNRVGLILADIPALAAPIAKAAGVDCWMMSNFGWDFIYRYWGEEFKDIADWMSDGYQHCDRLFRLPMHEEMSAFPHITDIGLTGGRPHYSIEELKAKFGLSAPKEKTIILSFGGLGLQQIPYHNLEKFSDWQFITFDQKAPNLANLMKIADHQYRPVDFMPLCGRLISKPGYSTFSETLINHTPIVSITREDFAESFLLLEGIQNHAQHQIITPEEFFTSNWQFLHQDLNPPRQSFSLATDGTEVIARAIVDYFYNR